MESMTHASGIVMAATLLLGLLQCFMGFRLFRFFLAVTGFVAVGSLAASLAWRFLPTPLVAILAGLVGGLIGAVAMVLLFYVGLFIVGGLMAALLEVSILSAFGVQLPPLMLLFPGVIGGLLALLWQRGMIIVATAFEGAASIVAGGAFFLLFDRDAARMQRIYEAGGQPLAILLLAVLVLGIVGIWVQYRTLPGESSIPRREPIP